MLAPKEERKVAQRSARASVDARTEKTPVDDRAEALCHRARETTERKTVVNTSEIVAKVAEAHDVSKTQAKTVVDAFLIELVASAASGEEISLPGFGKFKVKATPEREGRNPANGEKIKIAASKKLTFSPAKAVKDALNA